MKAFGTGGTVLAQCLPLKSVKRRCEAWILFTVGSGILMRRSSGSMAESHYGHDVPLTMTATFLDDDATDIDGVTGLR